MIFSLFFLLEVLHLACSQVFQPEQLILREKEEIVLKCTYNITVINNMFWYKQTGRVLAFLGSNYNGKSDLSDGFTMNVEQKSRLSKLMRGIARLKDAGVYFCAVKASYKVIFGKGTFLMVKPYLNVSEPSVYQLESKKESGDLAACLITDYSPDPINVKFNDNLDPVATNGSVVVVKDGDKESASLGVVLWSKNKDEFQCSAIYNDQTYKAEKEEDATCSETQSDTPVFETDERLNLLSLTVMGLRLIFFKSVALNLILTYWAWSR